MYQIIKYHFFSPLYLMIFATFTTIILFFKCIPHLPNFTPQIVFFFYLSRTLPKYISIITILFIALLSDAVVNTIYGFPIFGGWMLFNYSAYLLIAYSNSLKIFSDNKVHFMAGSFGASLFFWCWTNFGTWLLSGMYDLTLAGLIQCYTLAIPFLNYSLAAALCWGMVLQFIVRLTPSYPSAMICSSQK